MFLIPSSPLLPLLAPSGRKVDGGDVANGVWITGPSPRGGIQRCKNTADVVGEVGVEHFMFSSFPDGTKLTFPHSSTFPINKYKKRLLIDSTQPRMGGTPTCLPFPPMPNIPLFDTGAFVASIQPSYAALQIIQAFSPRSEYAYAGGGVFHDPFSNADRAGSA